jgi:hypothetical protein
MRWHNVVSEYEVSEVGGFQDDTSAGRRKQDRWILVGHRLDLRHGKRQRSSGAAAVEMPLGTVAVPLAVVPRLALLLPPCYSHH